MMLIAESDAWIKEVQGEYDRGDIGIRKLNNCKEADRSMKQKIKRALEEAN